METNNEGNKSLGARRFMGQPMQMHPNLYPHNSVNRETPQQRKSLEEAEEDALKEYDLEQQEQARLHAKKIEAIQHQEQPSAYVENHSPAMPTGSPWYGSLLTLIIMATIIAGLLLIGGLLSSIGLSGNEHGTKWSP